MATIKIFAPNEGISNGFYTKAIDVLGITILSSNKVPDHALYAAVEIVANVVANNPAMLSMLIANGAKVGIIGEDEVLTDLPDYADLYLTFPGGNWDSNRGVGGVPGRPMASVGAENLLKLPSDPYHGQESILLHEFAHSVMNLFLNFTEAQGEIQAAYLNAKNKGLWAGTYAIENTDEYFAELSQVWFHANPPSGHVHNDIDTREELSAYDPVGYALMQKVYRHDDWTPGKFFGGEGEDTILDTINNDIIFGMNGDDFIYISGGNDYVDGGAGYDVAIINAGIKDTTYENNHGTIVISGGLDRVELVSIEEIRFSDGVIAQSDGFFLVDDIFYLYNNFDVFDAGMDPEFHFANFGWREERNPNQFFDVAGYLSTYVDVAEAGMNPLEHYLMYGWLEGRDPSMNFDTAGYLDLNPDVAAAGVNPLEHYLQFGIHEGRSYTDDGIFG